MHAPDILVALRRDHEEVRARLHGATGKARPVREAAARLAEVCVPHFELEEKTIYAALQLLHDVTTAGEVRPDAAEKLKQVAQFARQHKFFGTEHGPIVAAVDALFAAADKEGDSELVDVAHLLRRHEKIEEELDLPAYGLASLTRLSL